MTNADQQKLIQQVEGLLLALKAGTVQGEESAVRNGVYETAPVNGYRAFEQSGETTYTFRVRKFKEWAI